MASTPQERLYAVYLPYSRAYDRRPDDWKEANSADQAKAVYDNVERLEDLYLKAAKQALDANGDAVEQAYGAAKAAQKAVDDAYKNATDLAEKIKLVGSVIGKVGNLMKVAGTS